MSFVVLKDLVKEYKVNKNTFRALDISSLEIEEGSFVIILGASGSGKSTLLNILGCMDSPTSGSATVDGVDITSMTKREMEEYRYECLGFIFQAYNLIGNLTALENIMISNKNINEEDAIKTLDALGIKDKASAFPTELSGGEAQRVAIARAIVKRPKLLLCDEPTGALDSKNGVLVMETLKKLSKDNKQTVIVVTHNPLYKEYADKVIVLSDGRVEE